MANDSTNAHEALLVSLQERAKELNCLYHVQEVLRSDCGSMEDIFQGIIEAIPPGWQYPEICQVILTHGDRTFRSTAFEPTPWKLRAEIMVQDSAVGALEIYYLEKRPVEDTGPFLKEEVRLVGTIAELIGHFILRQRLLELQKDWDALEGGTTVDAPEIWRSPLHLLRESDRALYLRIAHKLLNHLCRVGVTEAREVVARIAGVDATEGAGGEMNVPTCRLAQDDGFLLSDGPFELASRHLSDAEIISRVQNWMQEDKASSFLRVLNNPRSPLPEIVDAMRRFQHGIPDKTVLRPSTLKTLRVSLTQRLLTEQIDFVRVAKEHVEIEDFADLAGRMILPAGSHGRLGGKSAGLLLAQKILQRVPTPDRSVGEIRVPKTWYLPSDGLLDFIGHNDLQDVIEQKFRGTDEVRQEYPDIVRLFKNSSFPPRILNGLSVALDDFDNVPLIVRSSSLLEDRLGTSFSGKYKSLFVANQGNKAEKLEAVADAIAEVYASTFGPDPIEYRRERGLLEFNEEMGILIQEVVGTQVGDYFLPAFAGVAFSNSEFRWSPRIRREDGLIRLVPGLGTRAVDRVSDDYPILLVPGQPTLRANVEIDEIVRYSPKYIDLINLKSGTLESMELASLLREVGADYPALDKIFSVLRGDMLQKAPPRVLVNKDTDEFVATFNGLADSTPFLEQMRNVLDILEEVLGTPVDVEFAHDGTTFHLLQCRPQSRSDESAPSPIPKDIPDADVVFTADRHVSNGWVPDITHIVYVDPDSYGDLPSREDMLAVARAVGRLNGLLPRRRFILLGPGRWGSRGDAKLGVSVTYADISNTAVLIEIARRKGDYVPDVSFGTHFFQDLVESRIRYLPLYPDDRGIAFNEMFLRSTQNLLPTILPEFAHLADTIRVIDVPSVTDGRILRVLFNADLDEALAYISDPGGESAQRPAVAKERKTEPLQYWQWRLHMAERVAAELDPERFGVVAAYVFGSTKNATAGPASDIDILIHVRGSSEQEESLISWMEGWGKCLSEMNYLRTGYRTENLLDVHLVTDADIANKNSYAAKIGAVTDAARELKLRSPDDSDQ